MRSMIPIFSRKRFVKQYSVKKKKVKKRVFFFFCFVDCLRENQQVKWASLVPQLIKNLPAVQQTLVRFLGQEDPLEKG